MRKYVKASLVITMLMAILAGSVNIPMCTHTIAVAEAIGEADMIFFADDFARDIFESGKTEDQKNDYGLDFVEYDEKALTQIWRLEEVDYIIKMVINKATSAPEVSKIEMSVVEENDGKTYTRRGLVKENPNPNDKKGIRETSYYAQRTAMKKGKLDKKSSQQFPITVENFNKAYQFILETPTLATVDDMLYYAGNGNWSEDDMFYTTDSGLWAEMGFGCFGMKAIEELTELAKSKSKDKTNEYGFEFVGSDAYLVDYRLNGTENVYYSIYFGTSGKTKLLQATYLATFVKEEQRLYGFRRVFFDLSTLTGEMKNEIFVRLATIDEPILLTDAEFVQTVNEFMAEPTEEKFYELFDQLKEK